MVPFTEQIVPDKVKFISSTLHVPSTKFKLSVAVHRDEAAVSSSLHITDKIFIAWLQNQNLLRSRWSCAFPASHVDKIGVESNP